MMNRRLKMIVNFKFHAGWVSRSHSECAMFKASSIQRCGCCIIDPISKVGFLYMQPKQR